MTTPANKSLIESIEQERGKTLSNDQKNILNLKWVKENPTFTADQILEFYDLYKLYADYKSKKIDIGDLLKTAEELGLDKTHKIVFRILKEIQDEYHPQEIEQKEEQQKETFDFQQFVTVLTDKMGHINSKEGREAIFNLMDTQGKEYIEEEDVKRIADELKYDLQDGEAKDIVENIGGFGKESFNFDRFDKHMAWRIKREQDRQY